MASWIDWLKIIAEIIKLIAGGMSEARAAAKVGAKYGISPSEILCRMK